MMTSSSSSLVLVLVMCMLMRCDVTSGQGPRPGYIIQGSNADRNEYPYMALIKDGGSFICGGSLIKQGYVLTAKHCVSGGVSASDLTVVLGEHDRRSTDPYEKTVGVSHIIRHSQYDAALLKLNCAHPQTDGIRVVSRTTSSSLPSNIVATGWGWTRHEIQSPADVMQEAELPVVPSNQCTGQSVGGHEFCAGHGYGVYRNVCHGDSGSPVVQELNSGAKVQVGIVLRGTNRCPSTSNYAVFLRVYNIRNWINRNIRTTVSQCRVVTSDDDDDSSSGCFPPTSLVTIATASGSAAVSISSLQPGDRVLTVSTSTGMPVYTPFISYIHRSTDADMSYLRIATLRAHILHVSAKHLVYKANNYNVHTGSYVFAKDLQVGDLLLTSQTSNKTAEHDEIVSITADHTITGLYAPLTDEGTIMVDGVLASCYAEVPYHHASHMVTLPYRWWMSYTSGIGKANVDEEYSEMPAYFEFLQKVVQPVVFS